MTLASIALCPSLAPKGALGYRREQATTLGWRHESMVTSTKSQPSIALDNRPGRSLDQVECNE